MIGQIAGVVCLLPHLAGLIEMDYIKTGGLPLDQTKSEMYPTTQTTIVLQSTLSLKYQARTKLSF